MADFTVAVFNEFFNALIKLNSTIQKKTFELISKFQNNPEANGLNFEQIHNAYDDKLYSLRVDNAYRVILAIQKSTNTYVLLWVDHHNEAYAWAKNKKIGVNKLTGALQIYELEKIENIAVNNEPKVFDKYTDEQLLALGVPTTQLAYLRLIGNESLFRANKHMFSSDVYEYLEFLLDGYDYAEVLNLVSDVKKDDECSEDFGKAIKRPNRSFAVVEGQDELLRMFEAPLEKWRVFLHPLQKELVDKDFNGPFRVSGEAGTGKTVVAMHRAKYLLSKGNKVLFTTFTSNLVGDIENNIKGILSFDEIRNLEVHSVDSVIISYLKSKNKNFNIVYKDSILKSYWEKAISNAKIDFGFGIDFYVDEWKKVVSSLEDFTLSKYISTSRVGRGVRLDREQRLKVWHVFEEYMALLQEDNVRDIDFATYEARELLKKYKDFSYDSIIIDEGQDISANAYRFLRLLAGDEKTNDMFIVGDSHQRIYKNKAVLSKCGINVVGRSSILKINYRTTEETRKFAYGLLNGINFNELNNDFNSNNKCKSLTHGELPFVKNFENPQEQIKFVCGEIINLHNIGVKYSDICIIARNHKEIELALPYLTSNNISYYEINSDQKNEPTDDVVRIATMHRVKGLEFRYVFIISVNKDIVPMASIASDPVTISENDAIERCLLYVSLTRAQIRAYVLSFGTPSILLKDVDNEDYQKLNESVSNYLVKYFKSDDFVILDNNNSGVKNNGNNKNEVCQISDVLANVGKNFQDTLYYYLDTKKLNDVDVYTRAHIDRRLFSKIRCEKNYKPNKKTAICLCIGLMLDVNQSLDLLEKLGYVLSQSSKSDLIVKYYIENGNYDLLSLNNTLFEHGEQPLYL